MLDPNNQSTVYSAKDTSTALKDFIVKSGRTLDATVYSVSDGNEALLKNAGRVTLNKGHILEGSRADKIQRTVRYLENNNVSVKTYSKESSIHRVHIKAYTGIVDGEKAAFITTGNLSKRALSNFNSSKRERVEAAKKGVYNSVELGIRINNPKEVDNLKAVQKSIAIGRQPTSKGNVLVGTDATAAVIQELNKAGKGDSAIVISPYFDDFHVASALSQAKKRGANVKVVTSKLESSVLGGGNVSRRDKVYRKLSAEGIDIITPDDDDPLLVHAKAVSVKRKGKVTSFIGSHNITRAATHQESLDILYKESGTAAAEGLYNEANNIAHQYGLIKRKLKGKAFTGIENRMFSQGLNDVYRPGYKAGSLPDNYTSGLDTPLPYYPISLPEEFFLEFKGRDIPNFRLYSNLYESRTGNKATKALERLDTQMSTPSLGVRFNRLIGQDLYTEGSGVIGSGIRGIGKVIDHLFGYEAFKESERIRKKEDQGSIRSLLNLQFKSSEDAGPAEKFLENVVYGVPKGIVATLSIYVGFNLPLQRLKAVTEQETILNLIKQSPQSTSGTPSRFSGVAKQIKKGLRYAIFGPAYGEVINRAAEASTNADEFNKHILKSLSDPDKDLEALLTKYGRDRVADAKSGKLDLGGEPSYFGFLKSVRKYDAAIFKHVLKPIFEAINPYEYGTEADRIFRQSLNSIEELSGAAPTLVFKNPQSGETLNSISIKNIGTERISSIYKAYDKLSALVPLDLKYWVPSIRENFNLPAFDPSKNLTFRDIFSFEEATKFVDSTYKAFDSTFISLTKGFSALGSFLNGESTFSEFKSTLSKDIWKFGDSYKKVTKLWRREYRSQAKARVERINTGQSAQNVVNKTPPNIDRTKPLNEQLEDLQSYQRDAYRNKADEIENVVNSKDYKQYRRSLTNQNRGYNAYRSSRYAEDAFTVVNPLLEDKTITNASKLAKDPKSEAFAKLQVIRKRLGIAGLILATDIVLDNILLRGGVDLYTQLIARKDLETKEGTVARFKFEGNAPIQATLGAGLLTAAVTGYMFPKYVDSGKVIGFDSKDFIDENLYKAQQQRIRNEAAGASPPTPLRKNSIADDLAKERARYLQAKAKLTTYKSLKVNWKLAWASGLAASFAVKGLHAAGAFVANQLFNSEKGADLDPTKSVVSAVLESLASKEQATQTTVGDKTYIALAAEVANQFLTTKEDPSRVYNIATQSVTPLFQVSSIIKMQPREGKATFSVGFQLAPSLGQGMTPLLPFSLRLRPYNPTPTESTYDAANTLGSLSWTDSASLIGKTIIGAATFGSGLAYEKDSNFIQSLTTIGSLTIAASVLPKANEVAKSLLKKSLPKNAINSLIELREELKPLTKVITGGVDIGKRALTSINTLPITLGYGAYQGLKGSVGKYLPAAAAFSVALGLLDNEDKSIGSSILKLGVAAGAAAGVNMLMSKPNASKYIPKIKGGIRAAAPYYIGLTLARLMATPDSGQVDAERFSNPYKNLEATITGGLLLGFVLNKSGAFAQTDDLIAEFYSRTTVDQRKALLSKRFPKPSARDQTLVNKMNDIVEEAATTASTPYNNRTRKNKYWFQTTETLADIAANELYRRGQQYTNIATAKVKDLPIGRVKQFQGRLTAGAVGFTALYVGAKLISTAIPNNILRSVYDIPLLGSALELLSGVKTRTDKELFMKGESSKPKGFAGVLSVISNTLTGGLFDIAKTLGMYQDQTDPYLSLLKPFGQTFRESGVGNYFQFQSSFSDLSLSSYAIGSGTGDDMKRIARFFKPGSPQSTRLALARLRGGVPRKSAMQLGELITESNLNQINSKGLTAALKVRTHLMKHLSWQTADELSLDTMKENLSTGRVPAKGAGGISRNPTTFNPFAALGEGAFFLRMPGLTTDEESNLSKSFNTRTLEQIYESEASKSRSITDFFSPIDLLKGFGSAGALSWFTVPVMLTSIVATGFSALQLATGIISLGAAKEDASLLNSSRLFNNEAISGNVKYEVQPFTTKDGRTVLTKVPKNATPVEGGILNLDVDELTNKLGINASELGKKATVRYSTYVNSLDDIYKTIVKDSVTKTVGFDDYDAIEKDLVKQTRARLKTILTDSFISVPGGKGVSVFEAVFGATNDLDKSVDELLDTLVGDVDDPSKGLLRKSFRESIEQTRSTLRYKKASAQRQQALLLNAIESNPLFRNVVDALDQSNPAVFKPDLTQNNQSKGFIDRLLNRPGVRPGPNAIFERRGAYSEGLTRTGIKALVGLGESFTILTNIINPAYEITEGLSLAFNSDQSMYRRRKGAQYAVRSAMELGVSSAVFAGLAMVGAPIWAGLAVGIAALGALGIARTKSSAIRNAEEALTKGIGNLIVDPAETLGQLGDKVRLGDPIRLLTRIAATPIQFVLGLVAKPINWLLENTITPLIVKASADPEKDNFAMQMVKSMLVPVSVYKEFELMQRNAYKLQYYKVLEALNPERNIESHIIHSQLMGGISDEQTRRFYEHYFKGAGRLASNFSFSSNYNITNTQLLGLKRRQQMYDISVTGSSVQRVMNPVGRKVNWQEKLGIAVGIAAIATAADYKTYWGKGLTTKELIKTIGSNFGRKLGVSLISGNFGLLTQTVATFNEPRITAVLTRGKDAAENFIALKRSPMLRKGLSIAQQIAKDSGLDSSTVVRLSNSLQGTSGYFEPGKNVLGRQIFKNRIVLGREVLENLAAGPSTGVGPQAANVNMRYFASKHILLHEIGHAIDSTKGLTKADLDFKSLFTKGFIKNSASTVADLKAANKNLVRLAYKSTLDYVADNPNASASVVRSVFKEEVRAQQYALARQIREAKDLDEIKAITSAVDDLADKSGIGDKQGQTSIKKVKETLKNRKIDPRDVVEEVVGKRYSKTDTNTFFSKNKSSGYLKTLGKRFVDWKSTSIDDIFSKALKDSFDINHYSQFIHHNKNLSAEQNEILRNWRKYLDKDGNVYKGVKQEIADFLNAHNPAGKKQTITTLKEYYKAVFNSFFYKYKGYSAHKIYVVPVQALNQIPRTLTYGIQAGLNVSKQVVSDGFSEVVKGIRTLDIKLKRFTGRKSLKLLGNTGLRFGILDSLSAGFSILDPYYGIYSINKSREINKRIVKGERVSTEDLTKAVADQTGSATGTVAGNVIPLFFKNPLAGLGAGIFTTILGKFFGFAGLNEQIAKEQKKRISEGRAFYDPIQSAGFYTRLNRNFAVTTAATTSALEPLIKPITDRIVPLISKSFDLFTQGITTAIKWGGFGVSWLTGGLTGGVGAVLAKGAKVLKTKIIEPLKDKAFPLLKSILYNTPEKLKNAYKYLSTKTSAFVSNTKTFIKNRAPQFIKKIPSLLKQAKINLDVEAKILLVSLKPFYNKRLKPLIEKAKPYLKSITGSLKSFVKSIPGFVKSIPSLVKSIPSLVKSIPSLVKNAPFLLQQAKAKLGIKVNKLVRQLKPIYENRIKPLVIKARPYIKSIGANLKNFVKSVPNLLRQAKVNLEIESRILLTPLKPFYDKRLKPLVTKVSPYIKLIGANLKNFVKTTVPNFLTKTLPDFVKSVPTLLRQAKVNLEKEARILLTPLKPFYDKTLKPIVTKVSPYIKSIASGLETFVKTTVPDFVTKTLPKFVTKTAPEFIKSVPTLLRQAKVNLDIEARILHASVKSAYNKHLAPKLQPLINLVEPYIKPLTTKVSKFFKETVPNFVKEIPGFITKEVPEYLVKASKLIEQKAKAAYAIIKPKITIALNKVTPAIKTVKSFFTETAPKFFKETVPKFFKETVPKFFKETAPKFFKETVPKFLTNQKVKLEVEARILLAPVKSFYTSKIKPVIKPIAEAVSSLTNPLRKGIVKAKSKVGKNLLTNFARHGWIGGALEIASPILDLGTIASGVSKMSKLDKGSSFAEVEEAYATSYGGMYSFIGSVFGRAAFQGGFGETVSSVYGAFHGQDLSIINPLLVWTGLRKEEDLTDERYKGSIYRKAKLRYDAKDYGIGAILEDVGKPLTRDLAAAHMVGNAVRNRIVKPGVTTAVNWAQKSAQAAAVSSKKAPLMARVINRMSVGAKAAKSKLAQEATKRAAMLGISPKFLNSASKLTGHVGKFSKFANPYITPAIDVGLIGIGIHQTATATNDAELETGIRRTTSSALSLAGGVLGGMFFGPLGQIGGSMLGTAAGDALGGFIAEKAIENKVSGKEINTGFVLGGLAGIGIGIGVGLALAVSLPVLLAGVAIGFGVGLAVGGVVAATNVIKKVSDGASENIKNAYNAVSSTFNKGVNAVASTFNKGVNAVASTFNKGVNVASNWIKNNNTVKLASTVINKGLNVAGKFFSDPIDGVVKGLNAFGNWLMPSASAADIKRYEDRVATTKNYLNKKDEEKEKEKELNDLIDQSNDEDKLDKKIPWYKGLWNAIYGAGKFIVKGTVDLVHSVALTFKKGAEAIGRAVGSVFSGGGSESEEYTVTDTFESEDGSGEGGMSSFGKSSPVTISGKIPEVPVNSSTYKTVNVSKVGNITITGGYMEAHGSHSNKPAGRAIYSDGIRNLPSASRNLGIDYTSADGQARAWLGGKVTSAGLEGGYGYRVHVTTDATFNFEGKDYTVYQAYAHLKQSGLRTDLVGKRIEQGQSVGLMGGTGRGGVKTYADHIDLRTWIVVNGEKIDISPNLLSNIKIKETTEGSGRSGAGRTKNNKGIKQGGNDLSQSELSRLTEFGRSLYQHRNNPYVLAIADAVARAEGTDFNGTNNYGYGVMIGGQQTEDFSGHPFVEGGRKYRHNSSASGRYQIMDFNYSHNRASRFQRRNATAPISRIINYEGKDTPGTFSPALQDLYFIQSLHERGVLDKVLAGNIDKDVLNVLAQEYASIQYKDKASYYGGQGTSHGKHSNMLSFIRERLAYHQQDSKGEGSVEAELNPNKNNNTNNSTRASTSGIYTISESGPVKGQKYRIVQSKGGGTYSVTNYASLFRHHPSKSESTGVAQGRVYKNINGRREEVNKLNHNLVKKDYILIGAGGRQAGVPVHAPVSGYVRVDPSWGALTFYSDKGMTKVIGQIGHNKLLGTIKTGDYINYGQVIGSQSDKGSPGAIHIDSSLTPADYEIYLRDLQDGVFDGHNTKGQTNPSNRTNTTSNRTNTTSNRTNTTSNRTNTTSNRTNTTKSYLENNVNRPAITFNPSQHRFKINIGTNALERSMSDRSAVAYVSGPMVGTFFVDKKRDEGKKFSIFSDIVIDGKRVVTSSNRAAVKERASIRVDNNGKVTFGFGEIDNKQVANTKFFVSGLHSLFNNTQQEPANYKGGYHTSIKQRAGYELPRPRAYYALDKKGNLTFGITKDAVTPGQLKSMLLKEGYVAAYLPDHGSVSMLAEPQTGKVHRPDRKTDLYITIGIVPDSTSTPKKEPTPTPRRNVTRPTQPNVNRSTTPKNNPIREGIRNIRRRINNIFKRSSVSNENNVAFSNQQEININNISNRSENILNTAVAYNNPNINNLAALVINVENQAAQALTEIENKKNTKRVIQIAVAVKPEHTKADPSQTPAKEVPTKVVVSPDNKKIQVVRTNKDLYENWTAVTGLPKTQGYERNDPSQAAFIA